MPEKIHHHRICRTRGGSDEECNLMLVDRKKEQKMHQHHGVQLFHEKLVGLLDEWHSTDVVREFREKVHGLIGEYGPEMYEKRAVKNFDKFSWNFDKKKGIYVPKSYICES